METIQVKMIGNKGRIGFNVYAPGEVAKYVEFIDGVPTQAPKTVAEYLVKCEPTRFKIAEEAATSAQKEPTISKENINENDGKKRKNHARVR